MSKKAQAQAKKDDGETKGGEILANGTVVDGKVVTGKKPRFDPKEQGQRARGEIDDDGEATDKEAKPEGGPRVIKTSETLYQGYLTASAIASVTGEKVSQNWYQALPTTKKGCFNSFLSYQPSADWETFEVDAKNETDPTLRTSLE